MQGVTAIIVNYNTGDCLLECLQSLLVAEQPETIIVVDNASSDHSIDAMRHSQLDSRVQLIQNQQNLGFAKACNQGARQARADYLLFINPDCVVVGDAVLRLMQALQRHPAAALAGAWMIDHAGQPQRANRRLLPNPKRALVEFMGLGRSATNDREGVDQSHLPIPAESVAVEAVSGACMLLPRERFETLGGMDEDYVLHCEDLDLMKRIQLHRWQTLLVPEAQVVHSQGVSSRSRPFWVEWQKHRGMWRYYQKFHRSENNLITSAVIFTGILGHYLLRIPALLGGR